MAEVIPAILEKDFGEIEKKIRLVEGLTEWVQIDVADGILVPNTTFSDPKPFRVLKTKSKLEAHLMVKEPVKFIKPFVEAGFKRFYAHIESGQAEEYIATCYRYDCQVGLAIDGPTASDKIFPYLDNIDVVLVMAIEAGFSGRPFREDTLDKIKKIREAFFDLPIAVDGAMDEVNANKVIKEGANIICSNSYIFQGENVKEKIEALRRLGL